MRKGAAGESCGEELGKGGETGSGVDGEGTLAGMKAGHPISTWGGAADGRCGEAL